MHELKSMRARPQMLDFFGGAKASEEEAEAAAAALAAAEDDRLVFISDLHLDKLGSLDRLRVVLEGQKPPHLPAWRAHHLVKLQEREARWKYAEIGNVTEERPC